MGKTPAMKRKGRRCNERQQQLLVWSVDNVLISITSSSIVGPFICQSVFSTVLILRKRTNQGTALADKSEDFTRSLGAEFIHPIKMSQKRHCRASHGGAIQSSMELAPTTPRNSEPIRRNKSVASPSGPTDLFEDVRCNFLSVACTTEAPLENEILLDWVRNARRLAEFGVLRIS